MSDSEGGNKSNDGCVTTGSGATKIKMAYGKDSSDFVGSQSAERGKKLGGSVNDISHSLNGATVSNSKA